MNCWSHRPRSSRTSHSIDKPLFIRWWPGLFVFTIWSATELKKNIWGRAHIWTPPISIPWLRPWLTHLIQIISSLEVRSMNELCSDWHAPYTVSIAPYSLSRGKPLKFTSLQNIHSWICVAQHLYVRTSVTSYTSVNIYNLNSRLAHFNALWMEYVRFELESWRNIVWCPLRRALAFE